MEPVISKATDGSQSQMVCKPSTSTSKEQPYPFGGGKGKGEGKFKGSTPSSSHKITTFGRMYIEEMAAAAAAWSVAVGVILEGKVPNHFLGDY